MARHRKLLSRVRSRGVAGREILLGQFNSISGFVRNNPILTGLIGSGVLTTLGAGAVAVVRRRRSTTTRRRTRMAPIRRRRKAVTHRSIRRRRKRVTHRSPRHSGHKRVSFIAKGGKRVSFLVKRKRR